MDIRFPQSNEFKRSQIADLPLPIALFTTLFSAYRSNRRLAEHHVPLAASLSALTLPCNA
jgi:hypothetical protein